jgi:uncharacterized protein
MLFVIIATDGEDPEAPSRRARTRPAHLSYNAAFEERGQILLGGALVEGDTAIGSMIVASFPGRAELDTWMAADPYVLGDVWREIEVRSFRPSAGRWLELDPITGDEE